MRSYACTVGFTLVLLYRCTNSVVGQIYFKVGKIMSVQIKETKKLDLLQKQETALDSHYCLHEEIKQCRMFVLRLTVNNCMTWIALAHVVSRPCVLHSVAPPTAE